MPGNRPGLPPARARITVRHAAGIGAVGLMILALFLPLNAVERPGSQSPDALSDAEFWDFFTSKSEDGGTFVSENFVSNETSFQDVIPTLQGSLTPDGVYLGVGPEQNFTYIANLKPRLAVIFDIRRQNAMQHLMYKALFELSPTRAEFIERLFSRPFAAGESADVDILFDSVAAAPASDSAWNANHEAIESLLTQQHGFALSRADLASIEYLYRVFFEAGPGINYGFRPGLGLARTSYATFGMLQAATNAEGARMAFLASEANYLAVRDLHRRNLIVPVVGDFAGPTAIRAVGDFLWQRGMTVTAFYLSNVEQYLFRESGAAERFYGNVASLPTDSTSAFIRSVPRGGSMLNGAIGTIVFGNQSGSGRRLSYSISVTDSAGVRFFSVVQDSAGTPVLRVWRDSAMSSQRATAWTSVPGRTDSTAVRPDSNSAARADSMMAATTRALVSVRDSMVRQAASARDSQRRFAVAPGPSRLPGRSIPVAGSLTSGLVSLRETLEAWFAGRLTTYQSIVSMTKTTGWNER